MSKQFLKVRSGINLGSLTANPADPNEGDFYFNTTSNVFRQYISASWHDVVAQDLVQTLSNKTLLDSTTVIADNSDPTKQIKFDAAGTTGTSTTLLSSQTTNKTLTLPDATDTIVAKATTDSLTNKSLVDTSTAVVDSVDPTKKILFDAAGTTGTSTTLLSSQTTNKVLTLPDATDTLIAKATTDTLTNKTLQFLREATANDASSGTLVTLATVTTGIVRLTSGTLSTVAGIPAGVSGQSLRVANATGTAVTFLEDNASATAANRLYLGLTGAITVLDKSTIIFTYDTTLSRWVLTGGSGSSSGTGFKNILSQINSTFPGGVGDWITYDDGAVSSPIDGTGGSPSAITISGTTTVGQVLEGLQSLKIAKSAANGQGEGTSVLSKVLDRDDQGKPFYVRFAYDASDANYVFGDIQVFAYDVTNSQLLTVNNDNQNGKLLQEVGTFNGVIFPQQSCTQIRLILHITSTNATAYNIYVDEVVITPQATISGPVMTDWQTYTPAATQSGWGTVTVSHAKWRRIGDSMEVNVKFTAGTVVGGTLARFDLPNGLLTASWLSTSTLVGTAGKTTATVNDFWIVAEPGVSYVSFSASRDAAAAGNLTPATITSLSVANGQIIGFNAIVPIQDWTSGASLSANDAGLQTPMAILTGDPAAAGANAAVIFPTVTFDNYQAYSTTTGKFTCPSSGRYRVYGWMQTPTGNVTINAYVNNVSTVVLGVLENDGGDTAYNGVVVCKTGDTIHVGFSSTVNPDAGSTMYIEKIPDFNVFAVQGPIIVPNFTEWVDAGATVVTAVTTSPTKGTILRDKVSYVRRGNMMRIRYEYRQSTAGTAGSGAYLFAVPGGFQIDTSKVSVSTDTADAFTATDAVAAGTGFGFMSDATNRGFAVPKVYDSTHISMNFYSYNASTNSTWGSGGVVTFSDTAVGIFCEIEVPILGWTADTRLYPTQRVIGTTYLTDEKTSGTAGGTFTSGSYQTRVLNTQRGDTGFCSLSSNQFLLQPGTYEIQAVGHAYAIDLHKLKIRNITSSTDEIIGTNNRSGNADSTANDSFLKGRITCTATTTYELQHRCSTTRATSGFGEAVTFGDAEVYAEVKIDKVY